MYVCRWSKSLLLLLAQSGGQKLTVRIHGPYADPPAAIARQPDGVIIVAGQQALVGAYMLNLQHTISGFGGR